MNAKKKRILAGIERIEDDQGRARIDDLSDATGIDNRTINNALRYIEPDLVQVVGKENRGPCAGGGGNPKVLSLTQQGREIAEDHTVEMTDDQIASMWTAIDNLRARVSELEESQASLVKKNRKLRHYIIDDDI